jgi:hypothetical protein
MHPWLTNPRLAPTVLLTCGVLLAGASAVAGQQDPSMGGGRGMRHGGGGRSEAFDPVIFTGPPTPDSMAQLVGLEADRLDRYSTMYQNFMSSTQPERDSLAAMRQARRSDAGQYGGAGGERSFDMSTAREIRQDLENRQKQFDDALQDVLSKDQLKQYRDWRDQRRKDAQAAMQQRRNGHQNDHD